MGNFLKQLSKSHPFWENCTLEESSEEGWTVVLEVEENKGGDGIREKRD